MSELINASKHPQLRLRLLATVSALALTANAMPAAAQDGNRPTVWVELGAQYENVMGEDDPFIPPFDAAARSLDLLSIAEIENVLGKSFGGEGSLSFQPHGSDWIFMASARYGRTHAVRSGHAEKAIVGPPVAQYLTPGGKHFKSGGLNYLVTPTIAAYVDQNVNNSESHTIVDFQAGKDVGLGLFGNRTDSMLGFGARYIQMSTSSKVDSHTVADAEFHIVPNGFPGKYSIQKTHHSSAFAADRHNSVRALGPSLSLANATSLLGNIDDGELSLDWGANIAVLFGRQRTRIRHHTTTRELGPAAAGQGNASPYNVRSVQTTGATPTRSRNVTVPNVGGFAAVSYRFVNAKLSAGYRADFFFGALDRGVYTRNTETAGFHGPFATISIGLGG